METRLHVGAVAGLHGSHLDHHVSAPLEPDVRHAGAQGVSGVPVLLVTRGSHHPHATRGDTHGVGDCHELGVDVALVDREHRVATYAHVVCGRVGPTARDEGSPVPVHAAYGVDASDVGARLEDRPLRLLTIAPNGPGRHADVLRRLDGASTVSVQAANGGRVEVPWVRGASLGAGSFSSLCRVRRTSRGQGLHVRPSPSSSLDTSAFYFSCNGVGNLFFISGMTSLSP